MIVKELKNASFGWDDQVLKVQSSGVAILLTKVQMYSLSRFIIRVSQQLSRRRRK
ncbi:MAG TPA: hypothetical protein VFF49_04545 [Thermodesulfobacteriota bacterium]|nr:hypothetical protein [Thermodesulfobacteriota bacterium]